ncbi:MlaD family protein [Extensimonas sp. H3M7-6]|uniref:MlaD family protein n=1 Tax=Extensimonas soli TaxID=3031322 RepID=UPI0023DA0EFB|nr:MlaD family protein [Extensimonas sp. H3M7-6]MDF1481073.1 MlaD family protein [Extensimonas sp. H3M7-6]
MENKSHAIAAGVFVLVMLAMLAGLVLWLTRDNANYKQYELSTPDGVSGLQPQAAVRYKGVAVGKVTRIGFDPKAKGNVLIRIAVNEQTPISAKTYAMLNFQGVTGLAHVLLDDADKPQPPLPPGASGLPRLPLRSSPVAQIAEQAPIILHQIEENTRRLNQLLGDENQLLVRNAIDQIGLTAGQLRTLTTHVDGILMQRIDPALAGLPATLSAVQQAGNGVAALAQEARQTTARLNAAGGAVDQITQGTQSFTRAVEQFGGSTLPRINRATEESARTARQLGRVAGNISDNPQVLLFGPGRAPPGPGEPGFTAPAAALGAQP